MAPRRVGAATVVTVNEHLRRVLGRVLLVARAVDAGTATPTDLVSAAWTAKQALDNSQRDWRDRMQSLAIDVDAALDPWPPPAACDYRPAEALAAAGPIIRELEQLLEGG